jgi:predicted O-methyltransferase YrrM
LEVALLAHRSPLKDTLKRTRARFADSRLAPLVFAPDRIRALVDHQRPTLRQSARWLRDSREHTNFTYDLTPVNLDQLAWFCATVTKMPVAEASRYVDELHDDGALRDHIRGRTASTRLRWIADSEARYARRAGWYALVRASKPRLVIETGIEKGLGSVVLAAALLRNAGEGQPGRLVGLDIDPAAGALLGPPYTDVVEVVIGDSIAFLRSLDRPVDLFIHDSDHSEVHERAELDLVAPWLSESALVLSDNAHVTACLLRFAGDSGRNFGFFAEQPLDHWYPGAGIGVAYR